MLDSTRGRRESYESSGKAGTNYGHFSIDLILEVKGWPTPEMNQKVSQLKEVYKELESWSMENKKATVEAIILGIVSRLVPYLRGLKDSTAIMCREATMVSVPEIIKVARDDCAMWADASDALAALSSAATEAVLHPDYAANFAAKAVVAIAATVEGEEVKEQVFDNACEIWKKAAEAERESSHEAG